MSRSPINNVSLFSSSVVSAFKPVANLNSKLRLGHIVEQQFLNHLSSSDDYDVLVNNVQVVQNKTTIGEIDFVLESKSAKSIIHLEFAYKFYLFLPNERSGEWIGPNQKDSLKNKLVKLEEKQFPLIKNDTAKEQLSNLGIDTAFIRQELALLGQLFVPIGFKYDFENSINESAIVGEWMSLDVFLEMKDLLGCYLPNKHGWVLSSSENTAWESQQKVVLKIENWHAKKQTPMVWLKTLQNEFKKVMVVWW